MSYLHQKVSNEKSTFAMNKNYHAMCKTFVEVITKHKGNHARKEAQIYPFFLIDKSDSRIMFLIIQSP